MDATMRYGIDWSTSLLRQYPKEADMWLAIVEAFGVDRPDKATVFIAAHLALTLSRIASDRQSLKLLQTYLTPGFHGMTTIELANAAGEWIAGRNQNRKLAIETLRHLANVIEAAAPDDVEVRDELAEARVEMDCIGPTFFLFDWLRHRSPAHKAWDAAVKAFRKRFKYRGNEPLTSIELVDLARAEIARRASP